MKRPMSKDLPQTLNSNEEKEDDCTPKKVRLQNRSLRNDIYRQKLHRHYTWCSLREFQENKNAHKIHGSNNALREKQTNCEASHLQKLVVKNRRQLRSVMIQVVERRKDRLSTGGRTI